MTIEQEINGFLELWGIKDLVDFMEAVFPVFELYDVDKDDDWVRDQVGELNERNVRLIRTVYLMSKISDKFAGKLATINCKHKNLWKRLEDVKNE
jgi:hypothetical protein